MSDHLGTALAIAERIAAHAIWHEDRCNWIAPRPLPGDETTPAFACLPGHLYGGTAGVGLALAEVASATCSATLRRTAAGALRQAVTGMDEIGPERALGLYDGRQGIAVAALRGGMLLDEPALVEAGRAALAAPGDPGAAVARHDLTAGRAGAVVALLDAAAVLGRPALADRAIALGEELLDAARVGEGWSWPDPEAASGADPSGLSRGAAGIGHALMQLAAATGDARFRAAADGADAYERGRFDIAGWRSGRVEADGRVGSRPFWCHGAAGIALARHRAWRLTGDETRRVEAAAGLALTARWLRAAVRTARGDQCLCHGVAGNAEILWDCADAADDEAGALRALALEAAAAGVDEYEARGRPWPCGVPGGESPDLMLGLAGIARFHLRLHDPSLPSLLLPGPLSRAPAPPPAG